MNQACDSLQKKSLNLHKFGEVYHEKEFENKRKPITDDIYGMDALSFCDLNNALANNTISTVLDDSVT